MAALTGVKVILVGGEISKISYNDEEYAKVSGRKDEIHANPGDILLRINCARDYAHIGDYFEVNSDRRIVDRDGDEIQPDLIHYVIFEKGVAEQSETDAKLAELEGRIAALEAAQPSVQQAPQSVQYRKVTGRSPKVGDYVKYDEAPRDYVKADKYYEIIEIDSSNDPHILDEDGDDWDTVNDSSFEVYEKVDKPDAQQAQPQSLRVGDYAKVVDDKTRYGDNRKDLKIGQIVKIAEDDGSHTPYRTEEDNWFRREALVPATDEEVAEAAVAAKFAEIGRAVGEFKAGDIVKGILTGSVREYDPVKHYPDKHELITPVERRFDRD